MSLLATVLAATAVVQHPLDAIFNRPGLRSASIGAIVTDLDGKVLYERNATQSLMPASNEKLLSVAYALFKLGPEFRPVTRIWKLEDRIVVDCPGDPSMTFDRLKEASKKLDLKARTPIFVRQGYRPGWGPGWEWDDLPNRYAPQISAFTVDRGGFELWGNADKFYLKPANYGVVIREIPSKTSKRAYNLTLRKMTVYGPNPKTDAFVEGFAIPEPDQAAASILGGPLFETLDVPESEPTLTLVGDDMKTMAKIIQAKIKLKQTPATSTAAWTYRGLFTNDRALSGPEIDSSSGFSPKIFT